MGRGQAYFMGGGHISCEGGILHGRGGVFHGRGQAYFMGGGHISWEGGHIACEGDIFHGSGVLHGRGGGGGGAFPYCMGGGQYLIESSNNRTPPKWHDVL